MKLTSLILLSKNLSEAYGISNLFISYLIHYCKENGLSKINLEVNSFNHVAIQLYKKFGFLQVGIRKNYYKNGDGLLFTKIL